MPPGRVLPLVAACAAVLASVVHASAPPVPAGTARDSVAALLFVDERFADARRACDALLAAAPLAGRADSLAYAELLDLGARVDSADAGHADSARVARARLAVTLRERLFGPRAPEVFEPLLRLGDVLRLRYDWEPARATCAAALEFATATFGDSSLEAARAIRSLAIVFADHERPDSASVLLDRVLAIQERRLPPDDLEIALTLVARGHVDDWGDFARARRNYERVLAIRRRHLPHDSWPVAQAQANLANQCLALGDYDTAWQHGLEALECIRRHPGLDSSRYSIVLNNLAGVARRRGDLDGMRELSRHAVEMARRNGGPQLAFVLSGYASRLTDLGAKDEALAAIEECLRNMPPNDPVPVFRYEHTHGTILASRGDTLGALRAYRTAYAAGLRASRITALARSRTLAEIGSMELGLGHADSARACLERAAADFAAAAPDHPDLGGILVRLARALRACGRADSALQFADRSLALRRRALGPMHPNALQSATERALALAELGRIAEARTAALEAERYGIAQERLTLATQPERQAMQYAVQRDGTLDLALSLVADGAAGDGAADSALDLAIRRRALVLDEMGGRHARVADAGDTLAAHGLAEFAAARTRYANLALRGPASDRDTLHLLHLEDARRAAEDAERRLARGVRGNDVALEAGLDAVRESLPPGEALVSYVLYARRPRDRWTLGAIQWPLVYGAFVVRRGAPARFVDLGPAAAIDDAVSRWRERVAPGGGDEAATRRAGRALRRLLWDPLQPLVAGARDLALVPDGAVNAVSFGALPDTRGGYLVESGPLFRVVSAERDLVRASTAPPGGGLLALGGVDYEHAGDEDAAAAAAAPRRAVYRGAPPACRDALAHAFAPLPGSAREAEAVAAIWREGGRTATLVEGARAGETALKRLASGHETLHLATHGFTLAEDCGGGALESPLLRSGVVLAGANRRGIVPVDADDGILTAEEAAALDLRGTDCVVLSSCESGGGPVTTGEGVLGLQRAFRIAGARTLVLSLWPVDDESARRWMTAFHRAHVTRGLGVAQAARAASIEFLRRQRELGAGTHPGAWGAFEASGDVAGFSARRR